MYGNKKQMECNDHWTWDLCVYSKKKERTREKEEEIREGEKGERARKRLWCAMRERKRERERERGTVIKRERAGIKAEQEGEVRAYINSAQGMWREGGADENERARERKKGKNGSKNVHIH